MTRQDIIRLGAQFAEEDAKADDLWSWLPSYKAAERAHGDYACEHRPPPGSYWPKSAYAVDPQPCPPELLAAEGGPAWQERDWTGAATWHAGPPPAPAGVICDEQWRPVSITTSGGRVLPLLDAPAESLDV